MGRRKKNNTLTKIDPSILKLKPQAIAQHAASDGKRVITAVEPSHPLLASEPLLHPDFLDTEIKNFDHEGLEDDGTDEDISKGPFTARVRFFALSLVPRLIMTRTTHSSSGGQSAIHSSRSSYGSRAEAYPPTAIVNSAATTACSVASTVSLFSFFVQAA